MAYVGLSRHRDRADLYYGLDDFKGVSDLAWKLSWDRTRSTSLDFDPEHAEGRASNPQRITRDADLTAFSWSSQAGGYGALDAEQKARAEARYDLWREEHPDRAERVSLTQYVEMVQARVAAPKESSVSSPSIEEARGPKMQAASDDAGSLEKLRQTWSRLDQEALSWGRLAEDAAGDVATEAKVSPEKAERRLRAVLEQRSEVADQLIALGRAPADAQFVSLDPEAPAPARVMQLREVWTHFDEEAHRLGNIAEGVSKDAKITPDEAEKLLQGVLEQRAEVSDSMIALGHAPTDAK